MAGGILGEMVAPADLIGPLAPPQSIPYFNAKIASIRPVCPFSAR